MNESIVRTPSVGPSMGHLALYKCMRLFKFTDIVINKQIKCKYGVSCLALQRLLVEQKANIYPCQIDNHAAMA